MTSLRNIACTLLILAFFAVEAAQSTQVAADPGTDLLTDLLDGLLKGKSLVPKQETPYRRRAILIGDSLQVQPVDPQDRARSYYADSPQRFRIVAVHVRPGEVVLRLESTAQLPVLPTPPIRLGRWASPPSFTVVVQVRSVEDLTPERITEQLRRAFRIERRRWFSIDGGSIRPWPW